tara:strand:+ start:9842 stop:10735 length:894 start_codon:yes stop_codon:yes gene_type:complete
MANRKLTELPTLSPIQFDSTDLLYIVDVQTDRSKSIPFSLLAGDSFIGLSAYDTQNTLNVNFLSASIVTNAFDITQLQGGGTTQAANVQYLSGKIDLNRTDLDALSAEVEAADLSVVVSDVLFLSGEFLALSAAVDDIENSNVIETSIRTLCADIAYLSGEIDDNSDDIGTLASLTTTDKTNLVAAVNEVNAGVGGSSGFTPSTYTGQDSLSAPNGLITKFGTTNLTHDGDITVTFPVAFPNGFVFGVANITSVFDATEDGAIGVRSGSTTTMVIRSGLGVIANPSTQTASWMAIGY